MRSPEIVPIDVSHPEARLLARGAEIVAGALQVAGEKIFPVKAIGAGSKLMITPPPILKSLTTRSVNTTSINLEEIQKAIDTCVELEYIKESFRAEGFIDLRFLK